MSATNASTRIETETDAVYFLIVSRLFFHSFGATRVPAHATLVPWGRDACMMNVS